MALSLLVFYNKSLVDTSTSISMITTYMLKEIRRIVAATIEGLTIGICSWREPDSVGHEDCANSILSRMRETSATEQIT